MKNVLSMWGFVVRLAMSLALAALGFSNVAGAAEDGDLPDQQRENENFNGGGEQFRDQGKKFEDFGGGGGMNDSRNFGKDSGNSGGGRGMNDRSEFGRDSGNVDRGSGMGERMEPGRQNGSVMNNKGNERSIKTIKKLIEKLPAGWSVPQELTEALSKIEALGSDGEEADDVDGEREDLMNIIREYEQQLRMVSNYVKMEKQSGNEIKRMNKKITQAEAGFTKSGIDAVKLLSSARNAVNNSQTLLDKAIADAKTFSEDAQFAFQDFFESVGEAWQIIGSLDAVRQISKGTKRIEKNIASAKKKIQNFARKNPDVDVTEALALVDEAAKVVAELKAYVNSADFDPEEAVTYFEDLVDLHEQIDDLLDGQLDVNFFPVGMSKGMQGMGDMGRQGGMGQGSMSQRGGGIGPQGEMGQRGGEMGSQGGMNSQGSGF